MKNILKIAGIFVGGMLFQEWVHQSNLNKGEVIHEDDEKFIRVEEGRACGWSYGKVVWKKPQE